MSLIDPISQIQPQLPAPYNQGNNRRNNSINREHKEQVITSITIDLNSDEDDCNVIVINGNYEKKCSDSRPQDKIPAPIDKNLPRTHLMYQVVSRLGDGSGFGEKGQVVNKYL